VTCGRDGRTANAKLAVPVVVASVDELVVPVGAPEVLVVVLTVVVVTVVVGTDTTDRLGETPSTKKIPPPAEKWITLCLSIKTVATESPSVGFALAPRKSIRMMSFP
jgi:hypothetical protein